MDRVQKQVIQSVVLLSEVMTIILSCHSIASTVWCLKHHVFTYHTVMYHLHLNTSKPLLTLWDYRTRCCSDREPQSLLLLNTGILEKESHVSHFPRVSSLSLVNSEAYSSSISYWKFQVLPQKILQSHYKAKCLGKLLLSILRITEQQMNIFCEQNAKLFNVMAGGRCSNHCALKG